MYQILYMSQAAKSFNESELPEMLTRFRAENHSREISGLLAYHNGCFLQCIEGPDIAVHDLYAHICRDPRHYGVLTLFERNLPEREFPDWSMGYIPTTKIDTDRVAGFNDFFSMEKESKPASAKAELAYPMLESLRDELLRMQKRASA